eukprot:7886501-Pyramimonas_sp.AAC.3
MTLHVLFTLLKGELWECRADDCLSSGAGAATSLTCHISDFKAPREDWTSGPHSWLIFGHYVITFDHNRHFWSLHPTTSLSLCSLPPRNERYLHLVSSGAGCARGFFMRAGRPGPATPATSCRCPHKQFIGVDI